MRYFTVQTIKESIERLQNVKANWLLPAFVFAANDVGTDGLIDISTKLGTDQFLDRYFTGKRLNIPAFETGNNLLRPRLEGIKWNSGPFSGDYMVRQDTKMWGNLFSSRGYREMRLEGLIEGQKTITGLTAAFKPRFEEEIPESFRFEDFLVWLFAFEGFPDAIDSWQKLFDHLLKQELKLDSFKEDYRGRFRLSDPPQPWPQTVTERPTDAQFLEQLAPKLAAFLANPLTPPAAEEEKLSADDPVLATITGVAQKKESLAFLLAGPPGTGKTRYARLLAKALTDGDDARMLFLQFHPAIGYDDFVEGFRPIAAEGDKGVRYDLDARLFLKFAQLAGKTPDKKYVAVIDELNRGDVARIFGEVLTYLESDYRGVKFTLPFSGKPAVLPDNLIVIATANPFDRSVTDLDDALLRRFWVIELEPDAAVLKSHLQTQGVEAGVVNRTVRLFQILNEAFPFGFGHTNFLRVKEIEDLSAVWIGRVRLALKRALAHDRAAFEAVAANVESLLKSGDEADAAGGAEAQ